MKRAIRRQLRIWYSDIASMWGKFRTFHRTALGIIFAIIIVYAARKYWLDPLSAEVADLQSKYVKSEPPNPLPTIENDGEIILAQEQIIVREKNAIAKKREMETIAKARKKITQHNKESVLSEFASIVSQNKLMLAIGSATSANAAESAAKSNTRNTTRTGAKNTTTKSTTAKDSTKNTTKQTANNTTVKEVVPPLKYEEYVCKIEGRFSDVFNFLRQMESFSYPVKVTRLRIASIDQSGDIDYGGGVQRSDQLLLNFHLILYFH
ncbi:MAG: hypothetical protein LBQ66_08190 [Planctomycetaceae bacterium]|jgi:cobalamin biosynthesis Mg chelatase CobN|nr:hypothetical protein [Planctomycetaceae bacterium]